MWVPKWISFMNPFDTDLKGCYKCPSGKMVGKLEDGSYFEFCDDRCFFKARKFDTTPLLQPGPPKCSGNLCPV